MCFGGHTTKMKTSKPKRQTNDNQSEVSYSPQITLYIFLHFLQRILYIFLHFLQRKKRTLFSVQYLLLLKP